MKKSLSAIVSLAMAFSMFSSVAMGATSSADFTDLKDLDAATKAKFDALIKDGVFDGVSETTFGLKDKMNRAQFAKVAALIFGLKVDTTLTTSSFTDVKPTAEDPANGYALPYIEALKAAGLTDGFAPGQYNPAGDVTKQELATFLVRGLGWESQAKAHVGISDKSVSDWAKGYVGLAVEKKIIDVAAGTEFQGSAAATRELLVLAAHASKNANVPANVGISEVKASNYNQLTVSFNGPVAKDAAKLEVKKGTSAAVVKETKWSDDNRTATLILESKLTAADYSVTLSGITNLDSAKATATVKAEEEKITKVEFLNASDEIARNAEVRVEFRAVNQYGEKASVNANAFSITSSSATDKVTINPISGQTAIKVTTIKDKLSFGEKFAITIILQNSGISVSKVFTASEEQRVTKVEFGDLKNESGEKVSYVRAGKAAYLNFDAFDQYGYKVTNAAILNKGGQGVTVVTSNTSDLFFDKSGNDNTPFVADVDNDGIADLKLNAKDKIQGTYDVQAFASGSVANKKVEVAALKVPATLEFAEFNGTLADGDKEKYVTLKAKDSQGTELTASDLAESRDVLRAYGTGPINLLAESGINNASGSDKGKIKIESVSGKGPASIVVYLKDKPTVEARLNVTVQEKRKVDAIKFSDDVPASVVQGVSTKFKLKTFDQYNAELKDEDKTSGTKVKDFVVRVTVSGGANGVTLTGVDSTTVDNNRVYTYGVADIFDKEITVGNTTTKGSYELKFEIIDTKDTSVNDGKGKVVADYTRTIRVVDATEISDDMNYTVSLDKVTDSTLFGVVDYLDRKNEDKSVTAATYVKTALGKEIKLDVKDDSGKKIATDFKVVGASTSSSSVAQVFNVSGVWKVVGVGAGDATITVNYLTAKGSESTDITVKVKEDRPTVNTLSRDKGANTVDWNALVAGTDHVYRLFNELKVVDNYGTEYKVHNDDLKGETPKIKLTDASLNQFREILGLTILATDIVYTDGTTGSATYLEVDSQGKIKAANVGKTIKSFKLVAKVGGKEVQTDIDVTGLPAKN